MRGFLFFNKKNEEKVIAWQSVHGITVLRIALGIIFFWFGFLKFFPGISSAEMIAGKTIEKISFGLIKPGFSMPTLAVWECVIGIGLVTRFQIRFVLLLLYVQMIGTFFPLFVFPQETWTSVFAVPSLTGQYIMKNIVLLSSAIVIGATVHGNEDISGTQQRRPFNFRRSRTGEIPPRNKIE